MKAITNNSFHWPIPLEKYDRSNKVTKEELAHLQLLVSSCNSKRTVS